MPCVVGEPSRISDREDLEVVNPDCDPRTFCCDEDERRTLRDEVVGVVAPVTSVLEALSVIIGIVSGSPKAGKRHKSRRT